MPTIVLPLLCFTFINCITVLLGYTLLKRGKVWQSWLLMLIGTGTVYFTSLHQMPVLRMLLLISTAFSSMKVITATTSYLQKAQKPAFKSWIAFTLGWAGMRIEPFTTMGHAPLSNAWPLIRFGTSRLAAGLFLIALAHGIAAAGLQQEPFIYILISLLLLVGFSLILHFGLLSISTGLWRLRGVNVHLLFKSPVQSFSLTEFWGKRWNLAFSEMTAIAVVRPIKKRYNNTAAIIAAFLFSGLLHEMALSIPVNSGYGMPLLYFAIQGVLVVLEQKLGLTGKLFIKHRFAAKAWTLFWLIVPAPLLFHSGFIHKVLWPLAGL